MVIRANERSELALSDEFLVLHQRSAASRRRLFTDLLADGRSVATDTSDLGHSTVHHLFQSPQKRVTSCATTSTGCRKRWIERKQKAKCSEVAAATTGHWRSTHKLCANHRYANTPNNGGSRRVCIFDRLTSTPPFTTTVHRVFVTPWRTVGGEQKGSHGSRGNERNRPHTVNTCLHAPLYTISRITPSSS